MGKGRRRHFRRKKNGSELSDQKSQAKPPERKAYNDIIKENEKFERYYKTQGIVPVEEWDTFMSTLRENLPATFRITGYRGQAKALLNIIKGKYFEDLLKTKDESLMKCQPFSLPWYPGNLAWQMKLSRVTIRSSEELRHLHNFLVSETETGNISRQETVSMIPPLLLDVKPHHKVLDMCAAPGSKTAQLIEFLHKEEGQIPEGLIVANDLDNKRCYMLVHQAKRLNSPCLIITNNDAANFPNIKISQNGRVNLKFDRILCDVPCSGDGTVRKTLDIWNKWNTANGNNLHGLQLRILRRGLELLSIGGCIVYSTCSFNPVENEAVISTIMQEAQGSAELLDVRSSLQGLKTCPGISTWKVANKELSFFDKFEDVPEKYHTQIRPSMFPPSEEIVKELHLERCLRILPHHQDTGGFFVTVIQKNNLLPWEKNTGDQSSNVERSPPQKKRKVWGYKEDPFVFLSEEEEFWPKIRDFYKLKDFPVSQILSRRKEGRKRNLYFTSSIAKNVIEENTENIKVINTGVRILCRSENKDATCSFRLTQEGITTMVPFMNDRILEVTREDLIILLTQEYPEIALFSKDVQSKLSATESGCLIVRYTGNSSAEDEFQIELCCWKGNLTVRCYVPKVGRAHYLRICGYDVTEYEMREKKKFKIKVGNSEDVESNEDNIYDLENNTDSVLSEAVSELNEDVSKLSESVSELNEAVNNNSEITETNDNSSEKS